jgi:hypothetical protein
MRSPGGDETFKLDKSISLSGTVISKTGQGVREYRSEGGEGVKE